MDASELRIGNWVRHTSNYSHRNRDESSIFDFIFDQSDFYGDSECTISIENDITPIPLDDEWMMRFGFVNQFDEWHLNSVTLESHSYGDDMTGLFYPLRDRGLMDMHVKHVHQLQNLYHALTGEELTLKARSES